MDHDPDKHDDRAVALGMAVHWLMEHVPRTGPRIRFPLEQLEPRPGRAIENAPDYRRELDPTIVQPSVRGGWR